jgi:8-oxo-dGTP pyrophosphatase MutT (NUDIX family)
MNKWEKAWKSYIPLSRRVYGCICVSPNNKVLLVQGKYGAKKWSFPKGHREIDDITPLQCALREMKEETGLTLHENFIGTKRFRAGEYFLFLLPVEYTPCPEDKNEIECAKWFTLEEIMKMNKNVDVSLFTQFVQNSLQKDSQSLSSSQYQSTSEISDVGPMSA